MAKYLCLIPARGGSVSVKDKNLQNMGGVPLLVWSIWHARCSKKETSPPFVSTNDAQIAKVAAEWGAVVVWRPDELCTPDATTDDCILHAIEDREEKGEHYDYVITLQPTSPLRLSGLLDRCVDQMELEKADSLVTAFKMYPFIWKQLASPVGTYIWGAYYNYVHRPMRQDLRPEDYRYFDNGNIYISSVEVIRETRSRLGGKVSVCPVSDLENMQLDTPQDLEIFQSIFSGPIVNLLDKE